mgnify:FL=1
MSDGQTSQIGESRKDDGLDGTPIGFCVVCGKKPGISPEMVAITVPVIAAGTGKMLAVPGVYPACLGCRRALAHAERVKAERIGCL